ncbi:hypothetical protein [Clostridium paraputrificum]|uniref:Uncharacterized protein n=1 Tax=Clostridium paraputrificum TaxID=29363 RepID=A0A6N3F9S6_9CLOT
MITIGNSSKNKNVNLNIVKKLSVQTKDSGTIKIFVRGNDAPVKSTSFNGGARYEE